jgi:hypothetical protein
MPNNSNLMPGRSFIAAVALLLTLGWAGQLPAQPAHVPRIQPVTTCWLETSLKRVYPASKPETQMTMHVLAARNGRVSFQACIQNHGTHVVDAICMVSDADDLQPQIRRVGYVPMPHFTTDTEASELDGVGMLPGLVPDPLYPTNAAAVGPEESQPFWITLHIPADATPGERVVKVRLLSEESKLVAVMPVTLEISPFVIQPRHDFPVTHWWRGEAIWDWYKTGMFDERWWELTKTYLEDMYAHGSDTVYVPIFFMRRETFHRPCQLLTVNNPTPGQYEFDFARVKRFLDMAKGIGFKKFEWTHLWIYWGVENAMRVYKGDGGKMEMIWPPETKAMSETCLTFLNQFLPAFHDFLVKENVLADSYFHLSDEPGSGAQVENYKLARQFLHRTAPWMKVMDALSDVRYGREGLTDMPIPLVSAAQPYIDEKIPHWVYFCCVPHGPWINRFFDTPLPKVRMSGWLFYRLGAKGFLHWGFNYWHKMEQEQLADPFRDATAGAWPNIPSGDPFMVYPGEDGPIDSIRWEVFAESLQDYAILQTAGIKPEDPMLAPIKSYADFPKSEEWIDKTVERILKQAPEERAR